MPNSLVSKTITLHLTDEIYEELREAARAENRPLSNLIETAALSKVRQQQFVDHAEMAEILEDERLLRRIRTAFRQARQRKGAIVE
jgi:hypothetical protein